MKKKTRRRRCKNCHDLYMPDPRHLKRQKFCNKQECRAASKKYSQQKWLNKPENRNYFLGSEHVTRVPDNIIKAITAYIVGGRPESKARPLFLQLIPPYKPVNRQDITRYIKECMDENNLESSTYWLRHSYAQSLLVSGASIYEIKEMMGHKSIGSTQKYLSVHINLMREVILDETL